MEIILNNIINISIIEMTTYCLLASAFIRYSNNDKYL